MDRTKQILKQFQNELATMTGYWQCKKHGDIVRTDRHSGSRHCPKCRKNLQARQKNAILRELCGTSAAAARRDMGM